MILIVNDFNQAGNPTTIFIHCFFFFKLSFFGYLLILFNCTLLTYLKKKLEQISEHLNQK